jgi:hypothetical protein
MFGNRFFLAVGIAFGTRAAFAVSLITVIEEAQVGAQERGSALGSEA